MQAIKLNVGTNSNDLPLEIQDTLFNLSYNGIEVVPHNYEEFPMPWDAYCVIEDGMFILEGDLGQQGSHRGFAKVGIPLDRVSNYLEISIMPNDEEAREELESILSAAGWL